MPAKRNIKTYTKEELIKSHAIIGNQKNLEDVVYLTEVKFKDESEDSFVKCLHCGAKFAQLDAHIKKFHNQTPKEYLIQFEGASLVCKNIKDRVSGDKNPAAGHGGLYSKFSDKFIKYDGLTQEEINLHKKDVANKSKETKKANPHNENTKIEYYIAQGMAIEDAEEALSIRQSTFTLDKCVDKYGELVGNFIWQSRQDKWQKTLLSKPQEEIDRINRSKAPKINYSNLWHGFVNSTGIFYFIKISDDLYKFGLTTQKSIKKRYSMISVNRYSILRSIDFESAAWAFKLEKVISHISQKYYIDKSDGIEPFGWTETLRLNSEELTYILSKFEMLNDLDKIDKAYDKFILEPLRKQNA